MSDDLDLFGPAPVPAPVRPRTGMDAAVPMPSAMPGKQRPTMARGTDPGSSHATADAFCPAALNALQALVYRAICACGPIHDVDLERQPIFAGYAPSTVRKRRSELVQAGLVVAHDEVRLGRSTLTRWRVADAQEHAA